MTGGGGVLGSMVFETRHAARRLRRSPLFTALAVATVGLGVGAFSSVYAVVESVLLEPLPYEAPDELAWVWRDYSAWFDLSRGWLGGPDLAYLQEEDEVLAGAIALRSGRLNLTGRAGTEPREVRSLATSAGFFALLGVEPAVGRAFLSGEDAPGAPAVAVLTHRLWTDAFGRAPDIVGREIGLDGEPHTVVGVLADGFSFAMASSLGDPQQADVYVPLRMDLAAQSTGSGFLAGLVRIRSGVPTDRVEAALAAVADRVDEDWSGNGALRLWATPMKDDLVGGVRSALVAILAAAAFLLLILAANLATLLLARAAAGERDAAVRTALGGGRVAVAGTVVAEGALLAVAGGLVAIAVGSYGATLLARLAGDAVPRATEIGLDATGAVLAACVALSLVAAATAGPVVRVLRTEPGRTLREGGGRGGDSRGRVRGRGALVVAQVALSIVLLIGAGLLTRSLAGLLRVDPGFDPGGTLTARVALDPNAYPEGQPVTELVVRLESRAAALPGVAAVGVTDALPLNPAQNQTPAVFPGASGNVGDGESDSPLVDMVRVTPGYFRAGGLRLLAGRAFRSADAGPREAVIDDVLAARFFPDGSTLQGRVSVWGDTVRIVGVVDHARAYAVDRDGRGQVYVPLRWNPSSAFYLAVRTGGEAPARVASLVSPVRSTVRELDPSIPISEVRSLQDVVATALRSRRLNLVLVAGFALAALLLASLGVYGVVANAVVRRRPEIGVRMALGARGGTVVRMVLNQGLRLVVLGAVLGLVGAGLVSRFLASLLFGVEPIDLPTYGAVTLLLVTLAALAAWIPARRATRVHPADALRAE
jgi:putative ABC transport system permease protein